MTSQKGERVASKAAMKGYRRAEGPHKKLTENFLSDLESSWQQDGWEILHHLRTERALAYFQTMVRLTEVLHRRSPNPPEFDRHRNRADVLLRLKEGRRS
jgi:hypothetical protein